MSAAVLLRSRITHRIWLGWAVCGSPVVTARFCSGLAADCNPISLRADLLACSM